MTGLLDRTSYRNFEILIVDTGSTERTTRDYYASLTASPQIRIVDHPGPFNFSAANNAGAERATGRMLLFLNNDTEPLEPDWLEEMVRWAERPEIGIVGAKLLYPDGTIQHAGVIVGLNGLAEHIYRYVHEGYTGVFGSVDWYRNYMAVTGACMMMRRDVFDEVGRFDEAYAVAFSDFEICLRAIEHGYRILYTPFARLLHHEGATRGQHTPPRDTRRAIDRVKSLIESGDPYFNPNLSYESPVPTLATRGDRSRTALLARIISRLPS
jgi:GT2 family glycosyltransferase